MHDYLEGLDKGALVAAKTASANQHSAAGMGADSSVSAFLPMIASTGNPKPVINVGMPAPGVIAPCIRNPVLSENAQNGMQATKNDVLRLDLSSLQYDENGEPSLATVRGFVSQVPASEQGALLDTDGRPTRAAQERFTAVLFKKACGSEDLSRLQAQAVDPEIRNIFRAMITAAGRMSRLEGAGGLDIRSLVTRTAIQAVNARREGVKLDDYAKQSGMFGTGDVATDAGIAAIVDVFAKNSRSAKEMARILDAAASFAYSEANKPAEDMFGETQRATRQDVADLINKENADEPQQDFFGDEQQQAGPESAGRAEREGQTDLVEPAGAEPAREDVQREGDRAAADERGQADIGEAESAGELKFSEKKNRPMLDVARKSPPRTTPEANRAHSSAEESARPTLDVARKSPPSITSETLRAQPSSDQSIEESSRRGSETGSRSAEEVCDSLRSDSVVGDVFAMLERDGAVVVVSSVSELPKNVRVISSHNCSPYKSTEGNGEKCLIQKNSRTALFQGS